MCKGLKAEVTCVPECRETRMRQRLDSRQVKGDNPSSSTPQKVRGALEQSRNIRE